MNFVAALAYHFCLTLHATFTQPVDQLSTEHRALYILPQNKETALPRGAAAVDIGVGECALLGGFVRRPLQELVEAGIEMGHAFWSSLPVWVSQP